MFDTLYTQLGAVAVVAVAAFVFLKGDEPERIAMGGYLIGWLASMLVQNDAGLFGWQPAMFAIDLCMLLLYVGLGWKSQRNWPIWAASLQLLAVMGHFLPLVDYFPPAYAYLTVISLAGYGTLLAIGIGAFWAWQERRAAGLD